MHGFKTYHSNLPATSTTMDNVDPLDTIPSHSNTLKSPLTDIQFDFLVDSAVNTSSPQSTNPKQHQALNLMCQTLTPTSNTFPQNSQSFPSPLQPITTTPSPTSVENSNTNLDKEQLIAYFLDSKPEQSNNSQQKNFFTTCPSTLQQNTSATSLQNQTLLSELPSPDLLLNSNANSQTRWNDLNILVTTPMHTPIQSSNPDTIKMLSLPSNVSPPIQGHELQLVSSGPTVSLPPVPFPNNLQDNQQLIPPHSYDFQLPLSAPPVSYPNSNPIKLVPVDMKQQTHRKPTTSKALELAESASDVIDVAISPSSAAKTKKKSSGKRKGNSNTQLSLEERKKLRAERNRESAEKSRMRRKKYTRDLENNVALLRQQNDELKLRVEEIQVTLKNASTKVCLMSKKPGGEGGDKFAKFPTLLEALSALQRCIAECPRTFNRNPNSPLIPLNVGRKRQIGSSK